MRVRCLFDDYGSLAFTLTLRQRLMAGVSEEKAERTAEEQVRYLMAYLLDWHRREGKSEWWNFFMLADLEHALERA